MTERPSGTGSISEILSRSRERVRQSRTDYFSSLPEEILLRILSLLSVETLLLCQQLSNRLNSIVNDPQLWKKLYYLDYVRPRAVRIPGLRKDKADTRLLLFSSRSSKWLGDDHLAKDPLTDWKAHYRLRYNWTKGACGVSKFSISDPATAPADTLVRIQGEVLITASFEEGIKAWDIESRQLLTSHPIKSKEGDVKYLLTSLATETSSGPSTDLIIAIGFNDGHFALYGLTQSKDQSIFNGGAQSSSTRGKFSINNIHRHEASINGPITAISYTSPKYLATMNGARLLSIYMVSLNNRGNRLNASPRLLSSLRAHTAWPPLCLSVRMYASSIVVSVAYALPTYLSGWSVGLQEIRLAPSGEICSSRLATAAQNGPAHISHQTSRFSVAGVDPVATPENNAALSEPTSLSYSHPYLLTSHSDNTLSLHLVHSSDSKLSIGPAQRLWGHTSSVSNAQIGDRGRAVSFSAAGGDIRIWELEDMSRKGSDSFGSGVEVRPREPIQDLLAKNDLIAGKLSGIGFDDKRILLVKQELKGKQQLLIYNFK